MPNYYNPYQYAVNPYVGQMSYGNMAQPIMQPQMPMVQQSYATGPNCAMAWVDGEIEARGRQIPQGVTQLAMWDTNKQVIYLKSLNQMGMPNPMQILRYTIDEQPGVLPSGQGVSETGAVVEAKAPSAVPDMSQYVTKQDLENIKKELIAAVGKGNTVVSGNNQNGSNSAQNGVRGGNR